MELGTRNVKVQVGRRAKEPASEEMFVPRARCYFLYM